MFDKPKGWTPDEQLVVDINKLLLSSGGSDC